MSTPCFGRAAAPPGSASRHQVLGPVYLSSWDARPRLYAQMQRLSKFAARAYSPDQKKSAK